MVRCGALHPPVGCADALVQETSPAPCASISRVGRHAASATQEAALRAVGLAEDCADAGLGAPPRRLHRINETVPLEGQAAMTLLLDARKGGVGADWRPQLSIVVVCHNCERALERSLPRLLNYTRGCAELLLLLDQCADDSFRVAVDVLTAGFARSTLRRARVLEQPTPVWEAAGENLLMSLSSPRLAYVLVQPDNLLRSAGWDVQLLRPLVAHDDALGVSGFVAHAFGAASAEMSKLYNAKYRPLAREPGYQEAKAATVRSADVYEVRDTASRGPLMLHAAKLQALGFFDHELHWLEDSDHDLFCRARRRGWVVGAVQLATDVKWRLKTKLIGGARNEEQANASAAAWDAILRRGEAARLARAPEHRCLRDPSWVQRLLHSPPRAEQRPLPRLCDGLAGVVAGALPEPADGGGDGDRSDGGHQTRPPPPPPPPPPPLSLPLSLPPLSLPLSLPPPPPPSSSRNQRGGPEAWDVRRVANPTLDLCTAWRSENGTSGSGASSWSHRQQSAEQRLFLGQRGDGWRRWSRPSELPRGAVIVDVGSHVGNDIVRLLQRLGPEARDDGSGGGGGAGSGGGGDGNASQTEPRLRVHAFEPSSKYRTTLTRRVRPWSQLVTVQPHGIGPTTSGGCFHVAGQNGIMSYVLPADDPRCGGAAKAASSAAAGSISILAAADLLQMFPRGIELLNVNCEGCELEVLRGLLHPAALPMLARVRGIEVQFHLNLGCARGKGCTSKGVTTDDYCDIDARMRRAGCRLAWRYVYVWERWECGGG